jgi:hypothetical protein
MEWGCVSNNILSKMTDKDIREYHIANEELIQLKLQVGINGWRESTERRYDELVRIIELFEQKKRLLQ